MSSQKIKTGLKIRPLKRLGQNFLIEEGVFKKILEAAHLSSEDVVLEIGAGIGNLTERLAEKAKLVIGVEKDRRMIKILKEKFKDFKNVQILEGDIREKIEKIKENLVKDYKVVANIPYYLSSFLIRKFLENEKKPKLMVLMVQKEVAERICRPRKLNILAISVNFFAKAEIVSFVSKNAFWPRPKVDSAIIRIEPKKISYEKSKVKNFFKILKAGFSSPRKTILNNLRKNLKLNKEVLREKILGLKIDPEKRPEDLKIEEWLKISEILKI